MVRVLVVDDEPDYPRLLSIILSKEGFEVATATDASEALEVGSRFDPEVLIVDWMLNGTEDGLWIAEALRQKYPLLQTILITGYPSTELEARVERLPAMRFLAKPFTPADLIGLVREASDGF
ncbi:MAG: response regulator [Pirellulales bacterium]|nr:response regulator [Pirellulales bacterium]